MMLIMGEMPAGFWWNALGNTLGTFAGGLALAILGTLYAIWLRRIANMSPPGYGRQAKRLWGVVKWGMVILVVTFAVLVILIVTKTGEESELLFRGAASFGVLTILVVLLCLLTVLMSRLLYSAATERYGGWTYDSDVHRDGSDRPGWRRTFLD